MSRTSRTPQKRGVYGVATGTPPIAAGTRITIDPELLDPVGGRLPVDYAVVHDIATGRKFGADWVSINPDGTFDFQNDTGAAIPTIGWVAISYFYNFLPLQTTLGLNGADPSGAAPFPLPVSGFPLLPKVLYIDSFSPAGGNGSIATPFNTMADAIAFIAPFGPNLFWHFACVGTFNESPVVPPATSIAFVGHDGPAFLNGDLIIDKDATTETTQPVVVLWRFFIIAANPGEGNVTFRETGVPSLTILAIFYAQVDGQIRSDAGQPDTGGVLARINTLLAFDSNGTGFCISHSTLSVIECYDAIFASKIDCSSISKCARVAFGGGAKVLSTGGGFAPDNITDCQMGGNWEGPAGSALWDRVTFHSFVLSGGALVGAATVEIQDSDATRLLRSETLGGGSATPSMAQLDNTLYNVNSDVVTPITLPLVTASHDGLTCTIKQRTGTAAALSIDADPGQFIDGAASLALAVAGDAVTLVADLASGGWTIKSRG